MTILDLPKDVKVAKRYARDLEPGDVFEIGGYHGVCIKKNDLSILKFTDGWVPYFHIEANYVTECIGDCEIRVLPRAGIVLNDRLGEQ